MTKHIPPKILDYITKVQEYFKQYEGTFTIRQLYYRLVSKAMIEHNMHSYSVLCKACKVGRIQHLLPWNRFEDRSKQTYKGETYAWDTPEEHYKSALNTYENAEMRFSSSPYYYNLPYWWKQPWYVEVWIEKDALSGIVGDITSEYGVVLAVGRGYQSITNIHDAVERMKWQAWNKRKPVILYFGDYDPRGKHIPEVIERDFEKLGAHILVDKIALMKEQIEQYQLIPAPTKKTDTMAKEWINERGDAVYELDALEPEDLKRIVKEAIEKYVDKTILEEGRKQEKEGREKVKELVNEKLGSE